MGIVSTVLTGALMYGSVINTGAVDTDKENIYKVIPVPQQEINWNDNANKLNYLSKDGERSYEEIINAYLRRDFYVEECMKEHCKENYNELKKIAEENKKTWSADQVAMNDIQQNKDQLVDGTDNLKNKENDKEDKEELKEATELEKESLNDSLDYLYEDNNTTTDKDKTKELDEGLGVDDTLDNSTDNKIEVADNSGLKEKSLSDNSTNSNNKELDKDTVDDHNVIDITNFEEEMKKGYHHKKAKSLLDKGYVYKTVYFPKEEIDPLGNSLDKFYKSIEDKDINNVIIIGYASPDGKNPEQQIGLANRRSAKMNKILKNKGISVAERYSALCKPVADRSLCWKVDIFYK